MDLCYFTLSSWTRNIMTKDTLPKEELHQSFLSALHSNVVSHSDITEKPIEVSLDHPLPPKIRVYMYNVTSPEGDRPDDEYKSQLIAPGQDSGERGSFDFSGDHLVLLIGYEHNQGVFVLWDAYLHPDFSFSKTVYVKQWAIRKAVRGEIGEQTRNLQTGEEVVLTTTEENMEDTILRRTSLSRSTIPDDIEPAGVSPSDPQKEAIDYEVPDERTSKTTRKIRNTRIVNELKERYNYRCQLCDERRQQSMNEFYAEGHHIKPLGEGGPDNRRNILIVCPNHHADLDFGMVKIDPDSLDIIHAYQDENRSLSLVPGHEIDPEFLQYNNEEIAEF